MTGTVGFGAAFVAGVLSFLSPCVLSLVPGYLSFMTGMTTAELSAEDRPTKRILGTSLLFVAGFTVVFVALGASASALGLFLNRYERLIAIVFGLVVVGFGVLMLGVIRLPWLYGEARVDMAKAKRFGRAGSFLMGMAFAAGWTPCVGPILGVILGLAGSYGSAGRGALLLLVYSLGLGLPFILVGLAFGSATPVLRWLARHSLVINRVAGAVLIVIGVLIATGQMERLTGWLTRIVPPLA